MQHKNYLKIWKLSLLAVLISFLVGCGTTTDIKETKYIGCQVDLIDQPRGLNLGDVRWHVVTEQNIEDFLREFEEKNGNIVFMALSIPDYETLSLNMGEIRRYIEQQKSVIVYYENRLTEQEQDTNTDVGIQRTNE